MPFLTTCCCGFSVRTGTKAIAVLSLVSNTIMLVSMRMIRITLIKRMIILAIIILISMRMILISRIMRISLVWRRMFRIRTRMIFWSECNFLFSFAF